MRNWIERQFLLNKWESNVILWVWAGWGWGWGQGHKIGFKVQRTRLRGSKIERGEGGSCFVVSSHHTHTPYPLNYRVAFVNLGGCDSWSTRRPTFPLCPSFSSSSNIISILFYTFLRDKNNNVSKWRCMYLTMDLFSSVAQIV